MKKIISICVLISITLLVVGCEPYHRYTLSEKTERFKVTVNDRVFVNMVRGTHFDFAKNYSTIVILSPVEMYTSAFTIEPMPKNAVAEEVNQASEIPSEK